MNNFILLLLVLWLLILTLIFLYLFNLYRRFTHGIRKGDLIHLLNQLLSESKAQQETIKKINQALRSLATQQKFSLQKVGFIRYNPFADTGGDQSFCLAFLDGHNNGIVISSLHSRDQTRIYTKSIKAGKGDGYQLSKEEQLAIAKALSSPSAK